MTVTDETTPRTTITRLRAKARTERAELDALLDSCHLGHFALVRDGGPVVFPTAIVRDGDRVLAHGSTGSPWIQALADGAPASLAVTSWDGLVVARSAFESSVHYRSAVLFGSCRPAPDPERAMDLVTEALLPGRVAELRRPTARELAATLVVQLPIVEWSLKVSAGWPDDPPEDVAGEAWAGVVPQRLVAGEALPAPDLAAGIELPRSVRRILGESRRQLADGAP